MSLKLTEVMDKIKDRLTKVDPNNRKVIGIFQMKTGDDKWVLDLKDLKVYEGTVDNADSTIITDLETLVGLLSKKITLEEAKAEGKVKVEGNVELVEKATSIRS